MAGPYYGVSGTTSVYNPNISPGQTSASYLYVENGVAGDTNKIVVGWHVSFDISYYEKLIVSENHTYMVLYLNKFHGIENTI